MNKQVERWDINDKVLYDLNTIFMDVVLIKYIVDKFIDDPPKGALTLLHQLDDIYNHTTLIKTILLDMRESQRQEVD